MPPSRVGTVNLLESPAHVFVDENLKEVKPGSDEAAFIFRRADLDRVVARRKALGITGDEAARVQTASHKVALAEAERRAKAAEDEVAILRARVEASEETDKAAAKAAK